MQDAAPCSGETRFDVRLEPKPLVGGGSLLVAHAMVVDNHGREVDLFGRLARSIVGQLLCNRPHLHPIGVPWPVADLRWLDPGADPLRAETHRVLALLSGRDLARYPRSIAEPAIRRLRGAGFHVALDELDLSVTGLARAALLAPEQVCAPHSWLDLTCRCVAEARLWNAA